MNGAIVDIGKINSATVYMAVTFNVKKDGSWGLVKKIFEENQLKREIYSGRIVFDNIRLVGRELKGYPASLARFGGNIKPVVILSEIITNDTKEVIGYKIAHSNGNVKSVVVKELLAYCSRITHAGGIPIQNAIYVAETEDKKHFIRAYENYSFRKEVIVRHMPENVAKAKVNITENSKTMSRLEERFSKEQINELVLGKNSGVNIKIYGNDKLSAEQMQVIRNGLEEKLNVGIFASPEYSVEKMQYLKACLKYDMGAEYILNPEFSIDQMAEIINGVATGVDISKYADPSIPVKEMTEIRIRLENNIWREHEVLADESWEQ